jgi:threonine synthase
MDNAFWPVTSISPRLPQVVGYQCVVCAATYSLDEVLYTCPNCGPVGTLDVIYTPNTHRYTSHERPLSLWQQRDLLPLADEPPALLKNLQPTPLMSAETLADVAKRLDIGALWIKNDGLHLTGSFKDRASAMVVAFAQQLLGNPTIATASTGNAAAALAGMSACVPGSKAVIFVPAKAPKAKIAQVLVYGAKIILVDGNYDTAFDLCGEACAALGWYNRNTGINPITTEGKKTVAFEIAVQMNWDVPDGVVIPVGDGSIIGATYKGFKELFERGWISRIPRFIGVQSTGSPALLNAWENHLSAAEMPAVSAQTIADGISSDLPRDRAKALRAVRESGGAFIGVSDAQISAAIPTLAQATGVFAEPAAAAGYAALGQARQMGYLNADDRVLLLITGNGMKNIDQALHAVAAQLPAPTPPTLVAVREQIKSWQTT